MNGTSCACPWLKVTPDLERVQLRCIYTLLHTSCWRTKGSSVLLCELQARCQGALAAEQAVVVQATVQASQRGYQLLDVGRIVMVLDPYTGLPQLGVICATLGPSGSAGFGKPIGV